MQRRRRRPTGRRPISADDDAVEELAAGDAEGLGVGRDAGHRRRWRRRRPTAVPASRRSSAGGPLDVAAGRRPRLVVGVAPRRGAAGRA